MSSYDTFIARLYADLQAEADRGVAIYLSARSPLIPTPVPGVIVPPIEHVNLTFYGMPVVIDNSIPVNELHIRDAAGNCRIVSVA